MLPIISYIAALYSSLSAGRVIFHLSASNWPIVFSRIRNKIHYLAANMAEEGQDIVDLRLVTYSAIDQSRLVQVMQGEFPSLTDNGAFLMPLENCRHCW